MNPSQNWPVTIMSSHFSRCLGIKPRDACCCRCLMLLFLLLYLRKHGYAGVQTRYAAMGTALNKTGRPIVFSICCPYDPQFVPTKGGWVGSPNASQGGGNSWRIGCDMPGADFGIVMIVADVAASWGQHSGSGYAPGRPQIGPGKCKQRISFFIRLAYK